MYNVSDTFKLAIKQPSRVIKAKIEINGVTYDDEYVVDLSYEDTSNPTSQFQLGSTAAATIKLSLMNVNEVFEVAIFKPYLGLEINGVVEYVPLGVFYADDVERKKNIVNLTLFDSMIKFEQAYFSDLAYPTAITNVINEISTKTGIQFVGVLPNYQINKPEGYTYREMIGFIASLAGGFAKFDRDGKLTIKSYTDTSESITGDQYIDYNKKKDRIYRIDKITVKAGESTLSKGTVQPGGAEISFENPFMTEVILTDVYNKLNGFSYLPTFVKFNGNPALECGDIVTLTTIDNEIIRLPIMRSKLSFQGGLIGEITSEGGSENQNSFNSSGSITKKVERVVYEQVLINEALINKASIEDLQATNARVNTLEADVANIDTILAKAVFVELAEVGKIVAGSSIIAEGAIGSAQISDLSASKLSAGIADLSVVTIQGTDGRLKIQDNLLQVFDGTTALFERVAFGDVNKDGSVFGLRVRGADGATVLLDENGLTNEGFTDGYNKLVDDSLDPVKLDIAQVVTRINAGTTTINSSKIYMTDKTLDVAFSSLETTVTDQGEIVSSHSASITTLNNQISLKVDSQTYQTNIDGINTQLSTHSSEIMALQDEIVLKVTQTEIDNAVNPVDTRLTTAESTITQHSTEIALKVNKDGVISAINLSSESATIQAKKIMLDGYVEAKHIKSLYGLNVNNKFIVDSVGNVTFKGVLSGATGTFSGSLSGATGIFRGNIEGQSLLLDNVNFNNFGTTEFRMTTGYASANGEYYTEDGFIRMSTFNQALEFDRYSGGYNVALKGVTFNTNYLTVTGSIEAYGNYSLSANHQITNGYNGGPLLKDHNNGNVTISAAGDTLYLGYYNTKVVRVHPTLLTFGQYGVSAIDVQNDAIRLKASSTNYIYVLNNDGGATEGVVSFIQNGTGRFEFTTTYSDNNHARIRLAGRTYIKGLSTADQIQIRNAADSGYASIAASDFIVGSKKDTKKDIARLDSTLAKVKATPVYKYKYKEEANQREHTGLVWEDSPEELRSFDGIDIYAMASMLWKAVQELSDELDQLKRVS